MVPGESPGWKGGSCRLDRPAPAGPACTGPGPRLPAVQPGHDAGRARRFRHPLRRRSRSPADQRGVRGRARPGPALTVSASTGALALCRAPGRRARGPLGTGPHDAHRPAAGRAARPPLAAAAPTFGSRSAACPLRCGAGRRGRGGDGPRRVRDAPERPRLGDGPLRRRQLPRRRRRTADHRRGRRRDLAGAGASACSAAAALVVTHRLLAAAAPSRSPSTRAGAPATTPRWRGSLDPRVCGPRSRSRSC